MSSNSNNQLYSKISSYLLLYQNAYSSLSPPSFTGSPNMCSAFLFISFHSPADLPFYSIFTKCEISASGCMSTELIQTVQVALVKEDEGVGFKRPFIASVVEVKEVFLLQQAAKIDLAMSLANVMHKNCQEVDQGPRCYHTR